MESVKDMNPGLSASSWATWTGLTTLLQPHAKQRRSTAHRGVSFLTLPSPEQNEPGETPYMCGAENNLPPQIHIIRGGFWTFQVDCSRELRAHESVGCPTRRAHAVLSGRIAVMSHPMQGPRIEQGIDGLTTRGPKPAACA